MDKPSGLSTAYCARKIGKAIGGKTGHAGTLDPVATGLVLVMVGRATKLAPWLTGLSKDYTALIKFGQNTSTGDCEGEVLSETPVDITFEGIKEIVHSMKGKKLQMPPAYSAVKHMGQPLYKYAREGKEVEVKPREVEIIEIEIVEFYTPFLKIETSVSSGTYIRSMAVEMGENAGCGAHIQELRRTRIGHFEISDSLPYEEIIEIAEKGTIENSLISSNEALSFLPSVKAGLVDARSIAGGTKAKIDLGSIADSDLFRLTTEKELVALLRRSGDSDYEYIRVLKRPEEIEN